MSRIWRRDTTTLTRLALLAVLLSMMTAPLLSSRAQSAPSPNIILIVTDDLDSRLLGDALDHGWLPNIAALRDQGASFSRYFVTTPSCCPSRASILRGQYPHNTGVLRNNPPHGGFPTFHRRGKQASTIATWLRAGGYRTALIGKYLNGYPRGAPESHVPRGWDQWFASIAGKYFDYSYNRNGRVVDLGSRRNDYETDVQRRRALHFIKAATADDEPFFIYLAPPAPHAPAIPAPRHKRRLDSRNIKVPRVPSFNEADISDKPTYMHVPMLDHRQIRQIDAFYRKRLRSMLAVDDMVKEILDTLSARGVLDNTYVAFTSDNGFFSGEHRRATGKEAPYEEAIRVPLIVRGPRVAAHAAVSALASSIDLAPTLAEWAGATADNFVDGRSLVPLLGGETQAPWRHALLIEKTKVPLHDPGIDAASIDAPHRRIPPYALLRTEEIVYIEYGTGERELYDLLGDPYQLDNLAGTTDPVFLSTLSARLEQLLGCAAAGCRAAENSPVPSLSG